MTDPEPSAPALRASDAEREHAAGLLREAMASGRLDVDELDDRMQLVFGAKTRAELERLVADVLVPADDQHPIPGAAAAVAPGATRLAVRPGEDGTHRILSILSGTERRGRWRLAASCSVINVLGSTELDLSAVELAANRTELTIVSVLGGAEITLPARLNVEVSEVAILGGNEIDVGDERPDPGGPVVRLRIVSILSGAEVRRGPKLNRRQRRQLERREQGEGEGEGEPPGGELKPGP
ncbi:MAG: DUF1707 domain-containing protein [Solirubrobacteraceae bacterium]